MVEPCIGENLVVEIGADQMRFRARELQAHDARRAAAERQEDEGGDDVAPADHLVIDGREPADDAAPPAPGVGEPIVQLGVVETGIALIGGAGRRGGARHHFSPMR